MKCNVCPFTTVVCLFWDGLGLNLSIAQEVKSNARSRNFQGLPVVKEMCCHIIKDKYIKHLEKWGYNTQPSSEPKKNDKDEIRLLD